MYKSLLKKSVCILYFLLLIVVSQLTFFYKVPIGKIVKIEENEYVQKLEIRILNTKDKGTKIQLDNKYTFERVDSIKYRKGNQVILSVGKDGNIEDAILRGPRRDGYVLILLGILLFLLIALAGKKGVLSILSLSINTGIFLGCLKFFENSDTIYIATIALIFVFTVVTLLLVNGLNRQSLAGIVSTILTVSITLLIFQFARTVGTKIDYAALDYLTGDMDYESLFFASIGIAGLGAIMDVAVSIAATLNELIEKDRNISYQSLFQSGRAVGMILWER
ncbi:putative membrane protein [Aequitasia blattaphilus]|uniref:YibE/F family protein n=1 Tax=Aequitasia blattaphilus TaxID=2949332 RepID=A0ABT1E9H9_9FIRM|nr:YibE/F family protein [Aequitasia blattaphilus]MCP1102264.1 YibE/F family protein [Aequitasia blattaphilus]MCR8614904.1 YibE/F family protein [Aequitasia blattaphilus]